MPWQCGRSGAVGRSAPHACHARLTRGQEVHVLSRLVRCHVVLRHELAFLPSVLELGSTEGSGAAVTSSDAACDAVPRRIDSPWSSMRCTFCSNRSRIPAATGGSPRASCHMATGSWL